jgi:hypothetical protein
VAGIAKRAVNQQDAVDNEVGQVLKVFDDAESEQYGEKKFVGNLTEGSSCD